MSAPIITLFNNKGGVGKTSTLYHLSRMMALLGKQVLVADLDPQANLTSLCLEDDLLEPLWDDEQPQRPATVYHAVRPLIEANGDVIFTEPLPVPNTLNYLLLPGDLRLSQFEDKLANEWNSVLGGKLSGLNVTSAFARLIRQAAQAHKADIVFVDVGPNLGAINRAALIATDYVVIPLVPDLFSLQGLKNVGKYLGEWRRDWQGGLERSRVPSQEYPAGQMAPLGYIILQHRERGGRLVLAHHRWAARIPSTYAQHVTGQPEPADSQPDPNMIGQVRNYQSMMALAHEARKPIFELKPADGAIGAHLGIVREAYQAYYEIAHRLAHDLGIPLD